MLHGGQVTCVTLGKFSYYKSKYVGPFLRLPLSSIFCCIVALGPSTLSTIAESRSAVARDVDYPVLYKCLAREIKVIMHVRVRLYTNACVSRRMCESWQLCV